MTAAAPEIFPVFPLTGCLLLPGNWLPLNIFERRYRNMVEDVVAGDGYIGIIQPVVPRGDNWADPTTVEDRPELYRVGCLGKVERCEPQGDGRFLILLKGRSRFRIADELPDQRGYRRVRGDLESYGGDLEETQIPIDPEALLEALATFARQRDLSFDIDRLRRLPGIALLNGMAAALPFSPAEKQALLEAPGPERREEMLLSLMGMGLQEPDTPTGTAHPPVN